MDNPPASTLLFPMDSERIHMDAPTRNMEVEMSAEAQKPDAIVFIPGLGSSWEGEAIEGLGGRVITAFERNLPSHLRFHKRVDSKQLPPPFGATQFVKITESPEQGHNARDWAHLYLLDLPSLVTAPYMSVGPVQKLRDLGFSMFTLWLRIIRAFMNPDSEFRNQRQLILPSLILFLMSLGFLVLLAAVVEGFVAIAGVSDALKDTSTQSTRFW